MNRTTSKILGVLGAGIVAWGCGSAPPPTAQIVTSTAEIRAARELNAHENPLAQYHLKLANDQMEEAKRQIDDGDNEKAERLLVRAQTDAELAVALAREVKTKKAAEEAQNQLRAIHAK